ncbi:sensor histidine kinase, partial [Mesorhizobium sp. M00.F.Ca.ET.170.01.1.1]
RALDETLGQGALGKRLVSFKLWRRDGTILYSKNAELIGKQIKPNANLVAAFAGNVMVKYNKLEDEEDDEERSMNAPLLEIYNPVREPWSGEVVAVSEVYELSGDFEESLNSALRWSWLVVGAA